VNAAGKNNKTFGSIEQWISSDSFDDYIENVEMYEMRGMMKYFLLIMTLKWKKIIEIINHNHQLRERHDVKASKKTKKIKIFGI
jgi:hypothetical protein